MKDLQQIFEEVQALKKEMKEIRKEYRDILSQDEEYQEVLEKLKVLKDTKKQHELSAQGSMGSRWEDLEKDQGKVKTLQEMISDISLATLMEGKTVEVRDEYDNLYEPSYTVVFKKAN